MSKALTQLLERLQLEKIEEGLFRGQSEDLGLPQVFGGQVIGQALSAAKQTVASDRTVHSFHSYFLLPGDAHHPIVYDVETIRDGRSYATRRVKAIQFGRPIFYMTASFHGQEQGFEHQCDMPEVTPPEALISDYEYARQNEALLPAKVKEILLSEKPIEMRQATMFDPLRPKPCAPVRDTWFKANGAMPDDPRIHHYLLAYASDFNFLVSAAQPHGVSFMQPDILMATIDHAMWFHRDFRLDEWLLYHVESPTANNARALVRGQFFNRQGQLVASTMQEGVFRQAKRAKP